MHTFSISKKQDGRLKNIKMKKRLSSCLECGDDTSILTQVSGSPEAVLLCTDCYHLKYSHKGQNEIDYTEEEKVKKIVPYGRKEKL